MALHFPDEAFERRAPEEVGLDPERVQEATDYAKVNDTPADQVRFDLAERERYDESEAEHGEIIGPMPERRGGANGLVLREGYLVAEWGDTTRTDHAFSVAKSVLSLVAGVAHDRGLFDVSDPVRETVDDGGFDSPHNAKVTWEHLLQGTSEWEGTLFDKPDAVDRNRAVGKDASDVGEHGVRELREPGTYWEYNDVRINRLALSLLRVLGEPLPQVLRESMMDPIGASGNWEWHGYRNSSVEVDGRPIESVSGGGHWGGGLWIPTRDLARIGLIALARGRWSDERLVSEAWMEASTTPCPIKPTYGYLWWLNTDRELWPSAPESSFAAIGHGHNVLWVDPEHDLVAVVRWLRDHEGEPRADYPVMDGFFERLLDAVE
jgi:CubicO group peptidase (beta-lactamase class C family)